MEMNINKQQLKKIIKIYYKLYENKNVLVIINEKTNDEIICGKYFKRFTMKVMVIENIVINGKKNIIKTSLNEKEVFNMIEKVLENSDCMVYDISVNLLKKESAFSSAIYHFDAINVLYEKNKSIQKIKKIGE
ncbi:MAG: hypothetical protein NC181_04320 [Clostridium sp.]|nr:hypothetical protein [Clostridium sp.]MCM1444429.1 hypothetical protein [Candidatus Amulumruptor caecigallinarius]